MASLFPREEHAEALFHRILSNPGAEQQLYETFCMEQENASFEDGGGAECSFAKALLQAYENRDISALTILYVSMHSGLVFRTQWYESGETVFCAI